MSTEYWSVNEDDEQWSATCPQEAIEQADGGFSAGDSITLFCGHSKDPPLPSKLFNNSMINGVSNTIIGFAYDKYSEELIDGWEFDNDALDKYVGDMIDKWFTDNKCLPTFSHFSRIEEVKFFVTEVDDDGYIKDME